VWGNAYSSSVATHVFRGKEKTAKDARKSPTKKQTDKGRTRHFRIQYRINNMPDSKRGEIAQTDKSSYEEKKMGFPSKTEFGRVGRVATIRPSQWPITRPVVGKRSPSQPHELAHAREKFEESK